MTSFGPGWVGRTLGNRYKIEAILGRGGMSSVYRAHDPNLNRKVAIKIIHQHLTDNAEFIKRFEQEAALIGQLRHPNIIQVHDFNHEGNVYYMVMEYIPGETLSQRLEALKSAGIRLPLVDTVKIMTKISSAVDYAHQHRMIHRDLKPANVMLNLLGEPILMDFGIAQLVGSQSQTPANLPMGTAAYMSPELVRGEEADHRSDIYSLGIMLYEMLSGDPPFHDDSTYQVMIKQVNAPIPDIELVEMNTPQSLVAVVEKALAKEANGRYQTAGEMSLALDTIGLQLQGPADNLATRHIDRLSLMWQQAHDLFDERQWILCINKLDELRRTDPDYQHNKVTSLRRDALTRLAKQAERDYQADKFAASLTAVEAIRDLDPDYPINELEFKVQQGEQQAKLRQTLESLYREAVHSLEVRDYEQALAQWNAILLQKEGVDFPDKLMVERRAKEGLCTALYTQALADLTNNHPQLALEKMDRIRHINPAFPDSQNVTKKAKQMATAVAEPAKPRRYGLWAGLAVLLLLFIGGGLFLPRFLNGATAVTPTAASQIGALPSASHTATSLPTTTNTPSATETAVTTPTPQSSATPTTSPTITIAATAVVTAEAEDPYAATVLESITLFSEPDAESAQLIIIPADNTVWVLGRSETGNWLLVTDIDGQQGFATINRIDWPGNVETLPVHSTVLAQDEPTNNNTPLAPADGELSINLYPTEANCDDAGMEFTIFIQGEGGNGRYTYYWNDQRLAENTNTHHTFTVSSGGSPIIGTGRIVSGDRLEVRKELFLTKSNCNNE